MSKIDPTSVEAVQALVSLAGKEDVKLKRLIQQVDDMKRQQGQMVDMLKQLVTGAFPYNP